MAASMLSCQRRKFVNKVSTDMIKQLLDCVFEDRILNHGEKDAVLEANKTRADMARTLIDTVIMKGDAASRKFIDHLQGIDPTLSAELDLSPQKGPEGLTTTEQSSREKHSDRDVYPVTRDNVKNRVALLITNIKFTDERLNRHGAKKDEENMEKLLSDMGYEVVKYTNLTAKAIDQALVDFSAHTKLTETDSVMVVIMSHGKMGTILGVDWKTRGSEEFPIDNIFKHLGSERCPTLVDKPKIIIIQACRGEKAGAVLVSDGTEGMCDNVEPGPGVWDDDIEEDKFRIVHNEKDFVCLHSSTPDTVSYRHRDNGSFLIQYIVEEFYKNAHEDDVEELFRKVLLRFDGLSLGNKRQMATKDRCTMIKRFYIRPELSVRWPRNQV